MGIIQKKEIEYTCSMNLEEYKSFLERFVEFFKSILKSRNDKTDAYFTNFGESEEERQTIADGCRSIDDYYEEYNRVKDLRDEDLNDYIVNRIKEIVIDDKNIISNDEEQPITDDEIKESVNIYLNNVCIQESEELFEYDNLKKDDNGY